MRVPPSSSPAPAVSSTSSAAASATAASDAAVARATPQPSTDRVLWRLLSLCREFGGSCARVLGWQLVALLAGLGVIALTGVGIDYLAAALGEARGVGFSWPRLLLVPVSDNSFVNIGVIAAAAALLATARGLAANRGSIGLAALVHEELVPRLQTRVFAKVQHLGFAFFDRHSSGTVINRVTGDIQAVRQFVEIVLIQTVVLVLTLVVFTAYMLSIHVQLTLACLATFPIIVAGCILFSRIVHPEYLRGRTLFDRLILTLSESVKGVQFIKGFSLEPLIRERFEGDNADVRAQQHRVFWRVSIFSPSIDLVTQAGLGVLLIYGGWLYIQGEIALGAGLVVFAGLLQQFSGQVSSIAMIANSVQESLVGARRIFELLDTTSDIAGPASGAHSPERVRGEVVFDNVTFRYEDGRPVLRDVSFHVAPGQCVAIVGATGSGKSALLNLIPRFYDPVAGRVTLDGRDLREHDLSVLRRHIGVVFQESFLFSDTVRANIAFGRPDADLESVRRAALIASADTFVENLSEGYESVLGEYGVDLSGGQRQRLAIARAVLADPAVLVLDDPTAAIDPETEHEILEAIDRAIAGRTTFIVAHRLSTLRRADLVLVLEAGRLVQQGTHDELLALDGPYRDAALAQMLDEESRRLLRAATPATPAAPGLAHPDHQPEAEAVA